MPFSNTDALNKPLDVASMVGQQPGGNQADQSALIRSLLGGGIG